MCSEGNQSQLKYTTGFIAECSEGNQSQLKYIGTQLYSCLYSCLFLCTSIGTGPLQSEQNQDKLTDTEHTEAIQLLPVCCCI